jgi:hypothetical protein
VGLMILTFSRHHIDYAIQKVFLKNKVHFTVGSVNHVANFHQLTGSDEIKVDSDLIRFHISRVSSIFMSENGKYIITFAMNSENQIKRVIFVYSKGAITHFADDVVEIKNEIIKTSKGSVSVAEGSLMAN